jgi:hypothetical protein
MSRQNKANKNNYVQAGRLTPDESARERQRQANVRGRGPSPDRLRGKPAAPADVSGRAGEPGRRRPRDRREE